MTKKEDKEMEKQVEKLRDNFMYSLWDIIDDMYFTGFNKQEITKILIRDLKFGINTEYKILRSNHPNHIPCIVCEKTLKNVKKRVIKND